MITPGVVPALALAVRALTAPGDVVVIPAGAKHWHGAKADSWFSHIALEVPGEETRTEWLEPVSDAEYAALTEADS